MSDILAIDWIKALWADARAETDPTRKAQLERDAAVMEDAWNRSKYSLASTRDQITAALGNASLNLAERLDEVVSGQRNLDIRVGEIHTHVQDAHMLFSAFFDTFPPQFAMFQKEMREAAEDNRSRLGKLEIGQREYSARLDSLDERHGLQWEELNTLYGELKGQIQELTARVETEDARLNRKRIELDEMHQEMAAIKLEMQILSQQVTQERASNGNG